MAARLKERYERDVKPQLIEQFGYKSSMQAPRIEKITLNMGVGEAKQNTAMLDAATEQLAVIAGQKPAVRRARKSIANFKLREGMPVGVKVTLRGERMYEMLDRLQSIAIPRIRDFRGLNRRSFDGRGNYSLGIREQIIFPEVDYDAIDQVRGLDVTITTTAKSDDEAYELLRLLGMPFRRDGEEAVATASTENGSEPEAAEPDSEPEVAAEGAQEESTEAEPAQDPAAEQAEPAEETAGEPAEETSADAAEDATAAAEEDGAEAADEAAEQEAPEEKPASETSEEA